MLVVAFFIVEEIFAIVPAMFGGGLIGLAEQLMAKYEHLNVQSTLIVGSLVGLAAGLITNAYVIPLATTGGGFLRDIYPGDSLWAGAIGVAWGVLQSLLLLNWFKRKMT